MVQNQFITCENSGSQEWGRATNGETIFIYIYVGKIFESVLLEILLASKVRTCIYMTYCRNKFVKIMNLRGRMGPL
jgi:hypothetical protein